MGFVAKRPLLGLLILVLVNVALLSVQVRDPEGRLLLRSWGLHLFSPLASSLHLVTSNVHRFGEEYLFLRGVWEENRRLRRENALLKLEVARLKGLGEMVARTRSYSRLQERYEFDSTLAAVIWKSAPFYSHRLLVNAGSRHGVERGDAVITPEGIVGRILATTPYSAEVELITNAGAAAGAVLEGSRLQGIVEGSGSELLRLSFIPNYEGVDVGEVLYTSGSDEIYPKGLPIGRVVRSEPGALVYRDIDVDPFVDFSRVEEILVVRSWNTAGSDAPSEQAQQEPR